MASELSPELWESVFKKLGPPELHSCSQTCVTFHSILEPKLDNVLLSLVFRVLEAGRWISFHDACTCRLVSRSWKTGIDIWWQSLDYYFSLKHRFYQNIDHFRNPTNVLKFMTVFNSKSSTYNPFLSRSITIKLLLSEDLSALNLSPTSFHAFQKEITTMLEKFGRQVRHCEIQVLGSLPTSFLYQILQEILSLMPNLKVLGLGLSDTFYDGSSDNWEEGHSVVQLIESHPFPVLPHLVKLDLNQVPPEVAHEMVKCGNHNLKILGLRFARSEMQGFMTGGLPSGCDLVHIVTKFPNLDDLLVLSSYNEVVTSSLPKLGQGRWPHLSKLRLRFLLSNSSGESGINMDDLFRILKNFKDSLKEVYLEIEMPSQYDRSQHKDLLLRLPKLKKYLIQGVSPVLVARSDFHIEMKEVTLLYVKCIEWFTFTLPTTPERSPSVREKVGSRARKLGEGVRSFVKGKFFRR